VVRKYPPIDRVWLKTMIRAILPLFKWALENPDKDGDNVIRAIQACESTVWMKLRPGESLVSLASLIRCLIKWISRILRNNLPTMGRRF